MQAAIKSFLHEIDCMMENRCEAISDVEVQPKTLRKAALDALLLQYIKSVHFKKTVAQISFLSKLWYFLICIESTFRGVIKISTQPRQKYKILTVVKNISCTLGCKMFAQGMVCMV